MYDSNATNGMDTVFGEKFIKIDTSKFNAGVNFGFFGDTAVKVVAVPTLPNAFTFDFYKGVMPLTMYWYDSLFYSDSLPFPDLDPAPRAKGAYMCSDAVPSGNCNPDVWYIMCDTFNFMDNISPFKYSDSVVFVGTSGKITVGGFLLQIVDWNTVLGGVVPDKSPEEKFFIYPNPFSTSATLRIYNRENAKYEFTMYDLFGREVRQFTIPQIAGQCKIERGNLPSGMYFYKVSDKEKIIGTGKIIIQ